MNFIFKAFLLAFICINSTVNGFAQPIISSNPTPDSSSGIKKVTKPIINYRTDTVFYTPYPYDQIDRKLKFYQTGAIVGWVGSLTYFGSVIHGLYPPFTRISAHNNLKDMIASYEGKHLYRLNSEETNLLALNLGMANEELRKARRNSNIGIALSIGGFGAGVASLLYSNILWDEGRYEQSDNLYFIGAFSMIVSPYFMFNLPPMFNLGHTRRARKYIQNAKAIHEGRMR